MTDQIEMVSRVQAPLDQYSKLYTSLFGIFHRTRLMLSTVRPSKCADDTKGRIPFISDDG